MRKSRVQYLMTWVAFGLLLSSGLGLMILSWNGALSGAPSPSIMVLLWVIMTAAGIYLFMFAVKKAHRIWIDEKRSKKEAEEAEARAVARTRSLSRKEKALDVVSTARKLVRKIPEEESLAKSGMQLLKNLASELEIMSGILYIRGKNDFNAVATYALATSEEPYSFIEGEGLTGQAAANQQIMVLTHIPEEHREVYSGLGKSEPSYLAIVPLVFQDKTIAVLECSGFRYETRDIEAMFRVFARDLMAKISPHI
jgi:hypothetical protein